MASDSPFAQTDYSATTIVNAAGTSRQTEHNVPSTDSIAGGAGAAQVTATSANDLNAKASVTMATVANDRGASGSGQTIVLNRFLVVPKPGFTATSARITLTYRVQGSLSASCGDPCGGALMNLGAQILSLGFNDSDGRPLRLDYTQNVSAPGWSGPIDLQGALVGSVLLNNQAVLLQMNVSVSGWAAPTSVSASAASGDVDLGYCVTSPDPVTIVWASDQFSTTPPRGCAAPPSVPTPGPDEGPGDVCDTTPNADGSMPVCGFADTHLHQFANLGFGGLVLWGEPFAEGGIEDALKWCDFSDLFAVDPLGTPVPRVPVVRNSQIQFLTPIHGAGGTGDWVGRFVGEQGFLGHKVGGFPEFDGWPRWNSITHQQAYVDWLYRAFQGGLKLMVMPAVTNELFCRFSNRRLGFTCDDMEAVDRQIAGAKALEQFVDAQNGGPGKGWYRIVYTPKQARDAIAHNQLAVVLGVEVDSLFGCKQNTACSDADISGGLAKYYAMGVRHIFPVHVMNNGFAGTALYMGIFNFGNAVLNGEYFTTYDCTASGYEFSLPFSSALFDFFQSALPGGTPLYPAGAHCNARGLTAQGQTLVKKAMSQKMIIDTDHMSKLAFDATLDIARANNYPLIGGHSWFLDIARGDKRSEMYKNAEQLQAIRDLGGMVSAILDQGGTADIGTFRQDVPHDCGKSSKSWAQAYLYAAAHMGGDGVGFGSDFNGFAGEPAPRFGDDACDHDQKAPQTGGVAYPFTVIGGHGEKLGKSIVGNKAFDFNYDGMAHVGMYPDMIQDLRSMGVSDQDLRPLFKSAEQYIRMWEKIEAANANPPTATITVGVAPNIAGWYRTNVPLTLAAIANPQGSALASLTYDAIGAQPIATASVAASAGATMVTKALTISTEGGTAVTVKAADVVGNTSMPYQTFVNVDKTSPIISAQRVPSANQYGWNNTPVTVTFNATDTLSGIASVTAPITISTQGANQSVLGQAVDVAGNSATLTTGISIDMNAPAVAFSGNVGVYDVDATVAISCAASDALSGLLTSVCPSVTGAAYLLPAGTKTLTATAMDKAGNTASATTTYAVVATARGLSALTKQFLLKASLWPSFQSQLDAIASTTGAARQIAITDYITHVQSQTGKGFTTANATILIGIASSL